MNRWSGEAAAERELILGALDDEPGCISFRDIIERMDARYQERVSDEAAEKRWASLPLPGPEEHQLVQWWTNWNRLALVLGHLDGKRLRAVFLTIFSEHHSAIIAPQGNGSEEENTPSKRSSSRAAFFRN